MKRLGTFLLIGTLLIGALGTAACTNMSRTQQGALSGAAVGSVAGLGISALTGGSGTVGALIGGGVGALAGGLYGNSQEHRGYNNGYGW